LRGFVVAGLRHFGAEAQVRTNAVLVGAAFQVGLDFRLRGEHPRPLRVLLEGERVEMRLNVAGATRIGVVAPSAADAVGAFQHQKVAVAFLLQAYRHTQPGEAGADDQGRDWGAVVLRQACIKSH